MTQKHPHTVHLELPSRLFDQVNAFYSRQRVFGATCLGIAHSVFERERFDVCIVDEASQVLQVRNIMRYLLGGWAGTSEEIILNCVINTLSIRQPFSFF